MGIAQTAYRLDDSAHISQPWRIHELAPDFRVEDVWQLPGRGTAGDFSRLVDVIASFDPSHGSSRLSNALFALRWQLGELLGWDDPRRGIGARVPTLRDRLPADLRDAPTARDFSAAPFTWVYVTEHECAAEIANQTVHGVMHIGAVPDGAGGFRAQMAVLVKPNGPLGAAYMAAIRPFRHLLVYPPLMRDAARAWDAATGGTSGAETLVAG